MRTAEWAITGATLPGALRMGARGFVLCNEQVFDPGCGAAVCLSLKI